MHPSVRYHCPNLSWIRMNGPKASSLLGAVAGSLYLPVHEICMIDAQGSYVEVILSRVLAKFHRTTAENENICFQKCDFLVNTADGYCVWLWNLDKADVECGIWGFPCHASQHWVLLQFRFLGVTWKWPDVPCSWVRSITKGASEKSVMVSPAQKWWWKVSH